MDLSLEIISLQELGLRLALICAMGFLLGYDREEKHKPIGYQSYVIIGVITCLIAIMSQELYANFQHSGDTLNIDLAKIVAGTLTGIGFLGAGAIIKREDGEKVVGTATGASIWAAGGLGLMLGFGFYALSIPGFLIIWFSLGLLPKIINRITGTKG